MLFAEVLVKEACDFVNCLRGFRRVDGSPSMAAAALALTCAFHCAAVFGITFQVGVSGCAMICCICGLTVSGTGNALAGTSRGAGAGA